MIQVFSPSRIQPEPSRRARVSMPAGFDPNPGSVRPKHPMASPALEPRQPALFLLLASVGQNRIHHQRALHADETAQPGVAPLDLLHQQSVLDVAHAGAPIAFEIRAEETEASHLRDQLARETRLAEAVADQRQHPLVHELARRLAHQQFLLVEQRIDLQKIHTGE